MLKHVVIEPLNTNRHNRAAFSSGVVQVDNFLHKTAGKLLKGGTARVFVVVAPHHHPAEVLGFYSINAHSVDYGDLPNRYSRYALPGGSIPAAFISMMGVAQAAQGHGVGSLLLADALKGAYLASHKVGTAMVMLDILDCGNPEAMASRKRFYEGFCFQALSSNPLRMYIPMGTIAQLQEP